MRKPLSIGRTIVAILVAAVIFFPVYWMVISSLKTVDEMRLATPTLWPEHFMISNYLQAFKAAPFDRFFLNTVVQTAGLLVLQLNIAIMAAYSFAKGNYWGRDALFLLVLAALIIPEQVFFVPVYVLMSDLGWLNTFFALIVPHGASAYGIFLLRQTFKSINNDVVEAAKVDGAGSWSVLYKILTPMALPTVTTLGVLTFISSWNSYFWPLIMTNTNEMRVLTVGIAFMRESIRGDEALNMHIIMAASVMVIIPIVIVFSIAQKHIVAAMSNSTFK